MKVSMEMVGMDKLMEELESFSLRKAKEVSQEVNAAALEVQDEAKRNLTDWGAINTGHLRNSIIAEMTADRMGAEVGADKATAPYAPYVEFGTKPHWPPSDAIRRWVLDHKMPETAVFPISLKIARHGTRARPFLYPAFNKVAKEFVQRLRRLFE